MNCWFAFYLSFRIVENLFWFSFNFPENCSGGNFRKLSKSGFSCMLITVFYKQSLINTKYRTRLITFSSIFPHRKVLKSTIRMWGNGISRQSTLRQDTPERCTRGHATQNVRVWRRIMSCLVQLNALDCIWNSLRLKHCVLAPLKAEDDTCFQS